jgi:hypothetical protein
MCKLPVRTQTLGDGAYRGIFRNSAGVKARRVNRASSIAPLK